ncbi:MAG: hypothetical protein ACI4O4_00800 [Candidatus Ventricola sp.]
MTIKEYFRAVEARWATIDQNDREALHRFNEWKRELRKTIDEKEDNP